MVQCGIGVSGLGKFLVPFNGVIRNAPSSGDALAALRDRLRSAHLRYGGGQMEIATETEMAGGWE